MVIPANNVELAKIEPFALINTTRQLMPGGKADYEVVLKYPGLRTLAKSEGESKVVTAIYLLLKNFCSSYGVKRPMEEVQMFKSASWIFEESKTKFRLEDIQIMFTMAERGFFNVNDGKGIMDRVDIGVIEQIFSGYWTFRASELRELEEKEFHQYEQSIGKNYGLQIMSYPPYKHLQYNIKPGTWVWPVEAFRKQQGKRYVNFDAATVIRSLKSNLAATEEQREADRKEKREKEKAERANTLENFKKSYIQKHGEI